GSILGLVFAADPGQETTARLRLAGGSGVAEDRVGVDGGQARDGRLALTDQSRATRWARGLVGGGQDRGAPHAAELGRRLPSRCVVQPGAMLAGVTTIYTPRSDYSEPRLGGWRAWTMLDCVAGSGPRSRAL